jgi:hypothetical protein
VDCAASSTTASAAKCTTVEFVHKFHYQCHELHDRGSTLSLLCRSRSTLLVPESVSVQCNWLQWSDGFAYGAAVVLAVVSSVPLVEVVSLLSVPDLTTTLPVVARSYYKQQ